MILREYQKKAIESIRESFAHGNNRIVLCAPTGSGKTIIFSEITRMVYENDKSVLIITNRKELLGQTGNKLNEFGIYPEFLTSKLKIVPKHTVVVSMVETLKRRLKNDSYIEFIQAFNLIIIDEVHINSFNKIFDSLKPNQRVVGCTATPYRENPMPALENYYDSIVNVCQISELVKLNFLAEPYTYGIPIDLKGVKMKGNDYDERALGELYDDKIKYTGAVTNYEIFAKGKKTIVFCATIQNSIMLSEAFTISGYNSKHFDCYMNDLERKNVLSWFFANSDAILCNVGILTTGFDCAEIGCVLIYRATKSLPLFLQMVGRGSRIAPNKENFTILDFGNNIKTHNFWEADRIWTLKNPVKKKKGDQPAPVKECPNCGALVPAQTKTCKYCEYEFISEVKQKNEIEILLQNLTPSQVQNLANSGTLSVYELEQMRVAKNFKLGWIVWKLDTYEKLLEYEKLRGFKRGWAKYQQIRG